jgi:hypothetical protein
MAVIIGIDPHKGSHTAVAVGAAEEPLGELRVRACPDQAGKLVAWAQAWPERTWAVEGARGLGRLLAQQLVTAGERVAMCSPSWLPGSGCWRSATRTRPTRTMPDRWRSRRCGPRAARR